MLTHDERLRSRANTERQRKQSADRQRAANFGIDIHAPMQWPTGDVPHYQQRADGTWELVAVIRPNGVR